MSQHPELDRLEAWFGRSVGDVMAIALAVTEPAGSSPVWIEVLTYWGVRPISAEARAHAVRATGITRGAPIDELYDVLEALTGRSRGHLEGIDWPTEGPARFQWERLRTRIDDSRDRAIAWYRKEVLPARSGGMFANAMAAAQRSAPMPEQKAQPVMLRCHNCGAPRMDATGLDCEFCGHHLGQDKYGNPHGG